MLDLKHFSNLEVEKVEEISTNTIWRRHKYYLYESKKIGFVDNFYPIYKYGDLYSFSILPLLIKKGTVSINRFFVSQYLGGKSDVAGPSPTIDNEIYRIGGPISFTKIFKDRAAFVEAMATAMDADIASACRDNPNSRHVVLCGGRDSLNILLRRWTAPVVAYSAEPNYPLVAKFVDDNKLGIEVRQLEDPEPDSGLDREIAESACLVELENWKWTEHLRRIAAAEPSPPVFWKGQVADAILTDYWRSYTSRTGRYYKFCRKVYKRLARTAPVPLDALFGRHVLADLERTLWQRAAVAQGGHLGFLRSICNCLVLSAYHGPQTAQVIRGADLRALTGADLRLDIARALLGRDVIYPESNPAPPPSEFRSGKRQIETFCLALANLGLSVNH